MEESLVSNTISKTEALLLFLLKRDSYPGAHWGSFQGSFSLCPQTSINVFFVGVEEAASLSFLPSMTSWGYWNRCCLLSARAKPGASRGNNTASEGNLWRTTGRTGAKNHLHFPVGYFRFFIQARPVTWSIFQTASWKGRGSESHCEIQPGNCQQSSLPS